MNTIIKFMKEDLEFAKDELDVLSNLVDEHRAAIDHAENPGAFIGMNARYKLTLKEFNAKVDEVQRLEDELQKISLTKTT